MAIKKHIVALSLECDDIERTSGLIEIATLESLPVVRQKISEAFDDFNSGEAEDYDIFGFGFDEFVCYLKEIYGSWIINELEPDISFNFEGD